VNASAVVAEVPVANMFAWPVTYVSRSTTVSASTTRL
jgi:hypothetical protein